MNSWSAETSFAGFLATSFVLLRREVPQAYAQMCRQLAPRVVVLHVDGEVVPVVFSHHDAHFADMQCDPNVDVRTTKTGILSVVDAVSTMIQAILDDRLMLRGPPDDLLAFHDAFLTYVHGAVRAPSFPSLLDAYRRAPSIQRSAATIEGEVIDRRLQ